MLRIFLHPCGIDRSILCLLILFAVVAGSPQAWGQSSVNFTSQRSFVTSFTPVIGPRGIVGGVDVDTAGLLQTASHFDSKRLSKARRDAIRGVSPEIERRSLIRKVSLRRLEKEILQRKRNGQELEPDLLFLAGMQRIEYLFVYPDRHDVVIAGPADGWEWKEGHVVGRTSGHATLRLDDLLDALQATQAAVEGQGISCSIDPSEAGMSSLKKLLQTPSVRLDSIGQQEMESAMGDHKIAVTGIRPDSHFARVLVGADFNMKLIAMDFDSHRNAGIPSYLDLLKRAPAASTVSTPRWWLASNYDSLRCSKDKLAWELKGQAIRVMTEHGYLNEHGELINAGKASPLAQHCSNLFTKKYDELSLASPVFGQLQGCFDLAVCAAVLMQEDLLHRAECPLLQLVDAQEIRGESYAIPRRVPSLARVVRGRKGWVVSVERPRKLIQRYEGRDWVFKTALLWCWSEGSAATVAEAAQRDANSAGGRPSREPCGRR